MSESDADSVDNEDLAAFEHTEDITSKYGDPGVIQKVELINFMCHDHLKLDLSPNVNFLVGNNGSGKSAVLVALVTCLGASARFSNRSSKVGDLVKNGCHSATIRIRIRNQGDEAFKRDLYGDSITIERRILKEGGGSYVLRDHQGKKVSGTRDELDAILEQFNIQVDNPCNVLMQDASKLFLSSNKPERKYELFLKATQLEQMQKDLEETGKNIKLGETALASKEALLPSMEEKMKALETKVQALRALEQHRTRVKEMRVQLAWSHVAIKENDLEAINAEIQKAEDNSAKLEEAKRAKTEAAAEMRRDHLDKSTELEALKIKARDLTTEIHYLTEEDKRIKMEASKYDLEAEARRSEQLRQEKRKKAVLEEIRKLRAKSGGANENEYRQKLARAERKREEMANLEAELKTHEINKPTFERQFAEADERIRNLEVQVQSTQREATGLEREAQRLASQTRDRTAAFGVSAPIVRDLISKNKNLFSSPPIGPVGMYVTLLEEQWSAIVDNELGKTFDKFIVATVEDSKVLQDLMRRHKVEHMPQLMIMPFAKERYRIPSTALPDPRFQTLLSTIRIDDPTCFNAIIDDCAPECILVFAKEEEARQVMFGGNPYLLKNVRYAIAQDTNLLLQLLNGSELTKGIYTSKVPRLQVDVAAALEETRRLLKAKQSQLTPLQHEHSSARQAIAKLQRDLRHASDRLASLPLSIEKLQAEIEELERPPEVPPDTAEEIAVHEAALPAFDEKIKEEANTIAEIEKKKEEFLKRLEPVLAKRRSRDAKAIELEQALEEAVKQLDMIEKSIERTLGRIPILDEAMTKLGNDLAKARESYATQSRVVEEYSIKAQILGPRPRQPITEAPETIENRMRATEKLIAEKQRESDLDANVLIQYEESKRTLNELKEAIEDIHSSLQRAHVMLRVRGRRWVKFRKSISGRARALFISYLSYRNFEGQLQFDHTEKKLNIEVNPNRAGPGGMRDTLGLSGGERSYSTVALLLSLWDTMESPFRAMDEFDVFMDAVNRRMSMDMLLEAAKEKKNRQHIFLTPQRLENIELSDSVKVIRMRPPERNQRTITAMYNGNGHAEEDE